jgi:hypothetical protein
MAGTLEGRWQLVEETYGTDILVTAHHRDLGPRPREALA